MLTPKEVSERVFPKASFSGYNMAKVDEFLDQVTEDYSTLYKDNALLKSKMKMLMEKLEEYRATEDAMRKAMLGAQRVAESIVEDAKKKAETIVAEAEAEKQERLKTMEAETLEHHAQLREKLAGEEQRLGALRRTTVDYVTRLCELHENQRKYIESLSALFASEAGVRRDQETAAQAEPQTEVREEVQAEPVQAAGREKTPAERREELTVPASDAPVGGLYADLMNMKDRLTEESGGAEGRSVDFSDHQFGKNCELN